MKKEIIFALVSMILVACSNSGSSSSTVKGTIDEAVNLMIEYGNLNNFQDSIVKEWMEEVGASKYKKMSPEFAAEFEKIDAEAKAKTKARGEEIELRLSQLTNELADKSILTEVDLNVPLEVVTPFHITKLTHEKATMECTVKLLIDRVIKDKSIRSSIMNYNYHVRAYAEDENGNGIGDEFVLNSAQIGDYSNDLTAGTEVTLSITIQPHINQKTILTAHKIILLWPAPIDDIDDEMGADEGSEMD